MRSHRLLLVLLFLLGVAPVRAVIFDATGDPTFNTTAPGGSLTGSGWQYQGLWGAYLGTPIAPNYFVTANHVGGQVGETFYFQGSEYTTDGSFIDPLSDLRIWHVVESFPFYAPLYTADNEVGQDVVVIGRGTQRGDAVLKSPGDVLAGWNWGPVDSVQRWGTNTISGLADNDLLLAAQFDRIGGTEGHLSTGDSGGAVFIKDPADSIWKLAGINYAVTGPYFTSILGAGEFNAALFDQTGFFAESSTPGVFVPVVGAGDFYATRISARMDFIQSTLAPEPGSALLLLLGSAGLALRRRRSA